MLRSKIIVCFLFVGSFFLLSNSNIYAYAVDTDQIFVDKCEMCHGPDGKGTKQGIDFGVPDFTDAEWQSSKTDEEFVNSITNGKEDNPNYIPFGGMLIEEEIVAMASHVRKFVQ
jgi:mono/diheme cytochrome c family protein